jgi:putative membrane protein
VSARPVETQPERTGLAWQRTGLGVLAVAALISHGAFVGRDPLLLVAGGAVALLGLLLLGAVAPVRYRRVLRALAGGTSPAAPALAALATGIVAAAAVAAGAAVLAYP